MRKIVFVSSFLVLGACSDAVETQVFAVDNPRNENIEVNFDGQDYAIPAGKSIDVALEEGRHSLTFEGDTVHFIVNIKDQPAVINPTLTPHVLYSQIYQDNSGRDQFEDSALDTALTSYILEDGEEVYLPWRYTEGELFFNRYDYNWHYGLEDIMTDTHTELTDGSYDYIDTVNRTKLARWPDFLDILAKEGIGELPLELLPKVGPVRLSQLKVETLEDIIGKPLCPQVAEDLNIKLKEYAQLTHNTDPLAHRDLMQTFTIGFYSVYPDLFSEDTKAACAILEGDKNYSDENGFWLTRKRVGSFQEKIGASSAFLVK